MRRILLFGFVISLLFVSSFSFSATSWYFPEGSTLGDFELWILVTNPNNSTANITFTFYPSNGDVITETTTIQANKRYTLHVNEIVGLEEMPGISTKVECTNSLNIYAERAMYFTMGGHAARGVSGLEGCYIEISQPTSFPITISQSGYYKLTSDINCSTNNVNAIEITAESNVTLDLNGFTITGPGFGSTDGAGVYFSGEVYYINIINGSIMNFAKYGIHASGGAGHYFANLKICEIGTTGIYLHNSDGSIIEKCQLYGNSTYDLHISSTDNSIIKDNMCTGSSQPLRLSNSCTFNRIERNHCIASGITNDIFCDGTNNLFIENTYKNGETIPLDNVIAITEQEDIDLD